MDPGRVQQERPDLYLYGDVFRTLGRVLGCIGPLLGTCFDCVERETIKTGLCWGLNLVD